MTENKKIRLSGVAREYNVGINTIVEFLEKKGVAIERSPSTFVEGSALDMIRSEFGKDKMEKVNIREKIRTEQQSVSLEDKNRETDMQELAPEKEIIVKSPSIFNPPVENLTGPKVLGKIDLSPKKEQKAEVKLESSKEVKQEVVAELTAKVTTEPQKVEVVTSAVVDQIKAEGAPQVKPEAASQVMPEAASQVKPEGAPQVKPEAASQVKPEAAPQAKPEAASQVKPEAAPQAKPEVAAQVKSEVAALAKPEVAQQTKQQVEPLKVEHKQQEAAPVKPEKPVAKPNELFRANEPEKLAGPTVLGKMELPVARPSKSAEDKRGKRNRIKKNKVDLNAPGQAGQGQIPGRISGATTTPGAKPNQGNRPNTGGAGAGNSRFSNQGGGGRGKNTPRPVVKAEVSEEDVQKQIKETLARLTSKGIKGKGAKYRRDKRDAVGQRMAEEAELQEQRSSTLQVTEFVTVSELATMMDVAVTEVITACMNLGLMVSINQRLDAEALVIVAEEFGFKVEFVAVDIQEAIDTEVDTEEDMETRSPIVAVMGHVDHGKTSLLDYIRKANVIEGEAGGITQHIGAYSVKMDDGRRITFLDTPGHEAFTAMRARGAKVTDVAIIIAAADDAIMPQTVEAINHATAAGVPIIFAINKIDKPAANPEKIKEQLANMNYLVEDWGGKYQSQDIAAKTGLNVEKLLEKIILEADLLDLKANPNRKATGSVIESTLDKGRGFVTTILVQNGTLRVGDVILSGIYTGRVKAMFNERGQKIKEATPSTPVLVLGLNGAPQAGDSFNVMDDDKQARDIANKRDQLQRMQGLRTQKHITLDEIGRRIAIGSFKELNIIVKGDVDGSIEALTDSLLKLSKEEVQVNVIHKAVGQISESDILLAAASNAIVVGFQVRPSAAARRLAEKEEIDVRLYSIIYDAINEVKDAIVGMLAPITKEEITCSVEVLETFKITKVGTVAGCMVREGKITRNSNIRVIRDGIVVYTGRLGSLKRFKDDVKEVNSGYDCGLNIEGFNDIKVGDFVEGYEQVEVARKHS